MKTIQRHFFQNFIIGIAVLGLASAFLFTACNTTNKGNTDNDGQVLFIGDDIAIAETVYGKVRGLILREIYEFRGIPYGADTGGKNRFMVVVLQMETQLNMMVTRVKTSVAKEISSLFPSTTA